MTALSTLPVTLYPSRRKVLWMVAAMLAFLLASIWKFDELARLMNDLLRKHGAAPRR